MSSLNPDQLKAKQEFSEFFLDASRREFILTGGPGKGKTFLIKELIDEAVRLDDFICKLSGKNSTFQVCVTATTNDAASQLQEAMGNSFTVTTIHSALGLRVREDHFKGKTYLQKTDKYKKIIGALIIIDEASYIDDELKSMIYESTLACKIVYVGDKDQLLGINSSKAVIFGSGIHTAELTINQRFDQNSHISLLDEQIRSAIQGNSFTPLTADDKSVFMINGPEFKQKVTEIFTSPDAATDNRILAWTNSKVQEYNIFCRSLYTKDPEFYLGELLIANETIVNSRDDIIARNGERVKVLSATPSTLHGIPGQFIEYAREENVSNTAFVPHNPAQAYALQKKAADEKDWYKYFQYKKEFADFRSVYASTVYKAQGRTFDRVFVDLNNIALQTDRDTLLRLLLVAITRAKKEVYLYGSLPSGLV